MYKKNKKEKQDDECVKDRSCVFNDCTKLGTKGRKGPAWCPTEVDNEQKYIKGKWGNCVEESCKPLPNFYKNITGAFRLFSTFMIFFQI